MNALRDIKTASEIEVRLQTNEVLVHIPKDTPLDAIPQGIHDAGYKADKTVWLTAVGAWTEEGFLPKGWTKALSVARPNGAKDGRWEFVFKKDKDIWAAESAAPTEEVPQIRDEDI